MRIPSNPRRLAQTDTALAFPGRKGRFGTLLACAVGACLVFGAAPARADPLPEIGPDELFVWVVDDATAGLAYGMVQSVTDAQLREALRKYLLYRIYLEGGNPWALDPNWQPPQMP